MKKIFIIFAVIILTASVFAQAPQRMSYQAIIRNSSGKLVTSVNVAMRISIFQGSASETALYVETQTSKTDVDGLISIEIGGGTVVSGSFSTIDWSKGPYYIKTETDPTGSTSYSITGSSQLLSVPYALYAGSGSYTDLTNKPNLSDTSKYLKTETDPIFNASVAKNIKTTDTTRWGKKSNFSGSYTDLTNKPNLSDTSKYLKKETDPIFNASVAKKITSADTVKWNAKSNNYFTIPTGYTSAAIQAAVDSVGAKGGGIVFLPAGIYKITSTININTIGITLQGAGYGEHGGTTGYTTVLDGTGFSGGTIIQNSGYSTANNLCVKDMFIKGSSTAGGSASDAATGINLGAGTGYGEILNVWFENLYSYCINSNFANTEKITNCTFMNWSGTAIYYSNIYDQIIIGCTFESGYGSYAINTNSWFCRNIISNDNFQIWGANVIGAIYCSLSSNPGLNNISNNYFEITANSSSNVYGINNASNYTTIIGNNCYVKNSGSGEGIGIISSGDYCNVSSNNCKLSKTSNSISGTGIETGGANIDAP